MENVTIMDHPLIKHKISRLRDETTGTNEFRALVEEIAMLMGYEALSDLPTEEVEVKTPIETCKTPVIAGRKLAVVPIEVTHEPHEYYCKLPDPISERLIVVTDPMLATGGSGVEAVDFIKQHGGKNIKFLCIIAAPEGVKRFHETHPDVQLYVGCLDRELNKDAYICPGLGDAGDRIFGTK